MVIKVSFWSYRLHEQFIANYKGDFYLSLTD